MCTDLLSAGSGSCPASVPLMLWAFILLFVSGPCCLLAMWPWASVSSSVRWKSSSRLSLSPPPVLRWSIPKTHRVLCWARAPWCNRSVCSNKKWQNSLWNASHALFCLSVNHLISSLIFFQRLRHCFFSIQGCPLQLCDVSVAWPPRWPCLPHWVPSAPRWSRKPSWSPPTTSVHSAYKMRVLHWSFSIQDDVSSLKCYPSSPSSCAATGIGRDPSFCMPSSSAGSETADISLAKYHCLQVWLKSSVGWLVGKAVASGSWMGTRSAVLETDKQGEPFGRGDVLGVRGWSAMGTFSVIQGLAFSHTDPQWWHYNIVKISSSRSISEKPH